MPYTDRDFVAIPKVNFSEMDKDFFSKYESLISEDTWAMDTYLPTYCINKFNALNAFRLKRMKRWTLRTRVASWSRTNVTGSNTSASTLQTGYPNLVSSLELLN